MTLTVTILIIACSQISLWNGIAAGSIGDCRSTEGLSSGTFTSPNYPSNYRSDQFCELTLTVGEGYVIKLTFKDNFILESSDTCQYDFVEVIEVHPVLKTRTTVKRFCGTDIPSEFVSSSSSILVTFQSDGSNEYVGFLMDWTRIAKRCGSEMEGERGDIEYPSIISQETRQCNWIISVPLGKVVNLIFHSRFNLDPRSKDTCSDDRIEIFDVMGNDGPLVSRGSWCGNDQPPSITSYGSKLIVRYYREGFTTDKDFHATWVVESYHCSKVFNSGGTSEGYIMSYNYPDNLHTNVTSGFPSCHWEISIPFEHSIILTFHDCQRLKILEHKEIASNLTTTPYQDWCVPNNITDNNVTSSIAIWKSSAVRIELMYDYEENSGRGIYLSWRTECGKTFSTPKGNISIPGNGYDYLPNQDCEWKIERAKYHTIRLDFQETFDIESSNDNNCSYDYVEVLDSSPEGTLVSRGRFCGTQSPPQILSSWDQIVIRFHSDQSKVGKGFSVSWDTTCGDVYTSLQGNITSPWFPSPYPDNFDCKWEIQVPDGYTIHLTVSEPFSLEENTGCEADYLEVYDYTQNGSLSKRGRWCGQNRPQLDASLTSRMQLVFHSDGTKNNLGFQAQWTSGNISSFGCGKEFHSPNGTFTSPGFPQHYSDNLRCRWEIHASQGQRVKLDFGSTFDLEMSKDDCSYDSVEVRDSLPNGKLISYGKWCSVRKIPVFYSMSTLVVLFYSDTDKSGQGFSASWESEPECGGTVTGKAGHLLSPNYPSNYPENKECRWEIVPTPDGTDNVTLHFDQRFDLESDPECAYDYVEIYQDNELLGRWCGSDSPPDVTSGGQTLLVIFKSDKSGTGKGFLATLN